MICTYITCTFRQERCVPIFLYAWYVYDKFTLCWSRVISVLYFCTIPQRISFIVILALLRYSTHLSSGERLPTYIQKTKKKKCISQVRICIYYVNTFITEEKIVHVLHITYGHAHLKNVFSLRSIFDACIFNHYPWKGVIHTEHYTQNNVTLQQWWSLI